MNEKQHELEFCKLIARLTGGIREPSEAILFLLRTGLITRKTIARFMSIFEYQKQLKRTVTPQRPKGQKTIAMQFASAKVEISERQLHENLKKRTVWFSDSLFVQK